MSDSLPVTTLQQYDHGIAYQAAFHRSMPELRAQGSTPVSALDRLASRLVDGLDSVDDDFHRDLIHQALRDVAQVRLTH